MLLTLMMMMIELMHSAMKMLLHQMRGVDAEKNGGRMCLPHPHHPVKPVDKIENDDKKKQIFEAKSKGCENIKIENEGLKRPPLKC